MKSKLLLGTLCLILLFFNVIIYKQEQLLTQGDVLFFKLNPRDPRSLLQGDYMQLNYAISDSITAAYNALMQQHGTLPLRGQAIITLNKDNIALFHSIAPEDYLPQKHEFLLPFTYKRNRAVPTLSHSYFFEEGTAQLFAQAKYGVFAHGEGTYLLKALANAKQETIQP